MKVVSKGGNGLVTNDAPKKYDEKPSSKIWMAVQFVSCVAMIYGAYITQGRVSELLSKNKYGDEQVHFERLDALIGFQCMACFLWAALLSLFLDRGKTGPMPPARSYALIGVSNVIGPVCGVFALKNISYPAQVLAKSCKSVPIMLTGSLLYGKRYRTLEYVSALAIGSGVGLFAILSSGKGKAGVQDQNPWLGYALVAINLILDSYTNTGQDEIKRKYPKTTSLHMMCWTNFWGGLYYAAYFFLLSDTGMEVLSFCSKYPAAAWELAGFCLCGAFGQLAIFYTISQFGSLICSIVCTTRKFFSILASVLLAGSMLTSGQWGAVAVVFSGLLYKSCIRLFPGKTKKA